MSESDSFPNEKSLAEQGIVIKRKIGRGSYGGVFEADDDGEIVAFKIVHGKINTSVEYPIEIDVMSKVENPYITPATDVLTPRLNNIEGTGIVMPLAEGTSLVITDEPFLHRLKFVFQIAEGIKCLHRCGILHLDLKPINILVQRVYYKKKNKKWSVLEPLITDFGLSQYSSSVTDGVYIRKRIGTISYRPPENFEGMYDGDDADDRYIFSGATDIWSFAVTAFTIIVGRKFFPRKTRTPKYTDENVVEFFKEDFDTHSKRKKYITDSLDKVSDEMVPQKYRGRLIEFFLDLFVFDPLERPNINDVIEHDLFKNVKRRNIECYIIEPENWPPSDIDIPDKSSAKVIISRITKYISTLSKHLKDIRVSVLFHAIDIAYRFMLTRDEKELSKRWHRYLIAIACVSIACKYGSYRIDRDDFFEHIKKYLRAEGYISQKDGIPWKNVETFEEIIIDALNVIIYRRFMYDSARNTKELKMFYEKYVSNPEKYYSFEPDIVDTMSFTNPKLSYKSISDFLE